MDLAKRMADRRETERAKQERRARIKAARKVSLVHVEGLGEYARVRMPGETYRVPVKNLGGQMAMNQVRVATFDNLGQGFVSGAY
jgi:hypothetical protein